MGRTSRTFCLFRLCNVSVDCRRVLRRRPGWQCLKKENGSLDHSDDDIARPTAQYPSAEITPAEFETFVTSLFTGIGNEGGVSNLLIQNHEVVRGSDGTYDFDATVRYDLAGMAFLVIVEAKLHKNPIKRETVQVLHQKLQSVGAHKAVLISTAPFQRGAVEFALTHGIALVTVTEGRFLYETKSASASQALTRAEAGDRFGVPAFVGHAYSSGRTEGWTSMTLLSPNYPEHLAKHLLAQVPQ
jgi:hypothetical protein